MHRNILLGITAWLLGAATATAGCLLAVSLLGSGITAGGSGQLLSQDAANRELAGEAAKSAPGEMSAPAASTDPEPTLATVTPTRVRSSPPPPSATTPGAQRRVPRGQGAPRRRARHPAGPRRGTVLASSAGDVVATCQAAGAYLISWSPMQGYEADEVSRGPAAAASVTFESWAGAVTMTVSCSAGVPSATTSAGGGGDGGDD